MTYFRFIFIFFAAATANSSGMRRMLRFISFLFSILCIIIMYLLYLEVEFLCILEMFRMQGWDSRG